MNEYICQNCQARSYSSASYEYLKNKNCDKCGGAISQSESFTKETPSVNTSNGGVKPCG